jgi:predicted dehydrogenase
MVQMLVDVLKNDQPIAIQIYCGQYLPDWRPGADWRSSYSTKSARGGGVLRDLSHELDYLLLLGGSWRRVAALGGHLSSLEISSDDCWGLLVELDRCPVASLSVDYLNRSARRQIVINTNRHSYCADLVRGVMSCDGQEQSFVVARDDTYLAQHRAMLSADETWLCLLPHAERVMRLIGAAEQAAAEKTWVAA